MPRQTLTQRADGRYLVRYDNKCFYGKTQKETYQKRDAYKKMKEQGLRNQSELVTIADYAAQWLPTYKSNVSIKTYNDYVCEINNFLKFIGNKKIKNITSLNIQAFCNSISQYSNSYIKHHTTLIKKLFLSAQNDGLIIINPCINISIPKGTTSTHRALEVWEQRAILNMRGKHELTPLVMCMLYAGLRRGEALALNIDRDVNFFDNTINVREAVTYVSNQPIVKAPKTTAGIRTIPLFKPLKECLMGRHGLVFAQTLKDGTQNHATLTCFKRKYSSFITTTETMINGGQERWYGKTNEHKALLKVGKLPPWKSLNIRTHDFRHTFCTLLYDANVDIKTSQSWMGHADTKMILQIYAHLTSSREKEAALAVADKLESKMHVDFGIA